MKNIIKKISFLFAISLMFTSTVLAQLPPGFGDTTIDDTSSPAPISGLIALGIIVGGAIGYKKLKK